MRILIDDDTMGEEIGCCSIGMDDAIVSKVVKSVTGRHALYFVFEDGYSGCWDFARDSFRNRPLCEMDGFVFQK